MPREFPREDIKNTENEAFSTTNQDRRLLFFSKLKKINLVFLERYTSSAKEKYGSAV